MNEIEKKRVNVLTLLSDKNYTRHCDATVQVTFYFFGLWSRHLTISIKYCNTAQHSTLAGWVNSYLIFKCGSVTAKIKKLCP